MIVAVIVVARSSSTMWLSALRMSVTDGNNAALTGGTFREQFVEAGARPLRPKRRL